MPNHLSTFGVIHTAISLVGVAIGFIALFQDGKINPKTTNGRLYGIFTVLACLSSFLVMKTGHLSSAHNLSFLILILLPIVYYAPSLRIFGGKADYVQTIGMTATLFFSLVPAVVETLTRLPVEQPVADGPDSPVVKMGLLIMLVLFVAGMIYQAIKLKSQRKGLTPAM